jgi:PEP-CTERM motif
MNNKLRILFSAFCLVVLSAFSISARADTLTLKTLGPTVAFEPIYPYGLSVNGSSTITNLLCLSLNKNVTIGETWNVSLLNWATASAAYKEEAFIFSQIGKGAYSDAEVQFAAWDIFDPTGIALLHISPTNLANMQALVTAAQSAILTLPSTFYAGYVVYLPLTDPTSQLSWTNGMPQDFIGIAPEPSTIMLFGSGLIGIAGLVRRKLVRS